MSMRAGRELIVGAASALAEAGRLGSHRSVLLNGLATAGLFDEDEPDAAAGCGLTTVVGAGFGFGLTAARLMAAIAAAADGPPCPERKFPIFTLGNLSESLDMGFCEWGTGDGLETEGAAQECC